MAQSSTKWSAAQGEQASGGVQGQPTHLVWSLALGFDQGRSRAHEPQQRGITKRDARASAIAILYQTCKTWRKQLSDDGFCMRTFSLCRALADGKRQTLQRMQATIGRQLEQTSDKDVTDQAWWLDARSLMQGCNFLVGSGKVWSWLQAASQEPDGPLSRQAAATARMLGWHLVCWPDKPQVRFSGLCTLTGHSGSVFSVAYSPDGKHIVSGSVDKTVKVWDSQTGKEVRVLLCHRPIVCCCVY
jgi:WD40 repeat protein